MADEKRIERAKDCFKDWALDDSGNQSELWELLADFAESELKALPANPDARAIAERIADGLFVDGAGKSAKRLIFEYPGGFASALTGWSKKPFTNQIESILSAELPRWIPVGERLPKESGTYLISRHHDSGGFAVNEAYYIARKTGFFEPDGGRTFERVTAWQPLPEPYKSEVSE